MSESCPGRAVRQSHAISTGRSGKCRPGVAEDRLAAGVAVLDVEDGIVARLLDHLGEVEIEHRIVLAVEHHEADRVAADLVHHFAQRDEFPCPFRHFDGPPARRSFTSWMNFDIKFGSASAFKAFTAACMRLM